MADQVWFQVPETADERWLETTPGGLSGASAQTAAARDLATSSRDRLPTPGGRSSASASEPGAAAAAPEPAAAATSAAAATAAPVSAAAESAVPVETAAARAVAGPSSERLTTGEATPTTVPGSSDAIVTRAGRVVRPPDRYPD